jgi:mannan endo-1,4-beta-mannosidase
LLPGGENHQAFVKKLDQIAAFFVDLKGPKDELVPVIFHPFHE